MNERRLTGGWIDAYRQKLVRDEKGKATVEKYLQDVRAFFRFAGPAALTKEFVMAYKQMLVDRRYGSINSMLGSVNSLLECLGRPDCKVRAIRQQRQIYCAGGKRALTKAEYLRLLDAAKCAPPADPGRQHGDDCYEKVRGERACTLSTEPAQPELICGKREIVPHEHASACQGSCGKTQAPDTCNRACFQTVEVAPERTCAIPDDHVHGALCYGAWELICSLEEHAHTMKCYSDPAADVEDAGV